MKLHTLFEGTPDRQAQIRALFKAGVECTPEEFRENFDAIIDLQDRLNKMYDEIEDKLGTIRFDNHPSYEAPQVHSTVSIYPNKQGEWVYSAWWYFDTEADDFDLTRRAARPYIERMFKKYLPELKAEFDVQDADGRFIDFNVTWKDGEPLSKLKVFYTAPDTDDNNHSNAHRKALKWW